MALGEGVRSGLTDRSIVQGERSLSERPTEPLNTNPERAPEIARSINVLHRSPALNDRPERSAHERVLSALRAKDGVLFGSQVALGAAFGWSKTRLHEVLHELEAAGRVRLSINRQGTVVKLVGGTA
jgi:DNA-binding GntR family transcriptional regulator